LGLVPGLGQAGEIVKRALAYPYRAPERSFVQVGGRTLELPPEGLDLNDRVPLLAYGANAAPEALARKLAPLPELPLPVLRAELRDFDVVYSAHISPYGSVPATLRPSPGTTVSVFVAYPTEEQLGLLSETEPNYELEGLTGISCRLARGPVLTAVDAYLSRHGCLAIDGAEVALAAIEAVGRELVEKGQPEVLEHVRAQLFPELSLERFVSRCVEGGGLAPLPKLTTL
jgi:hypothetical protein